MAHTLVMYPRGYVSRQTSLEDGTATSNGNRTVDKLQQEFNASRHTRYDWQFISNLVQTSVTLFGDDINKWLAMQLANPYIYGSNLDFIDDTIRYISTGARHMPLTIWTELLIEAPEELNRMDREAISTMVRPRVLQSSKEYIQQWLAHDDGMYDLIQTLHILFGYTGQSLKNEASKKT